MSGFKFSKPGKGKAGFVKDDHEDHLLAFIGVELEAEVSTAYGDTEAAKVETVVCFDCPLVVNDQLIFGAALVPRLTSAEDTGLVLGRLVKGEAKPGRNAPWLLEEPLTVDEQRAEEFFERYASRLKSGRIVVELPEKDDDEEEF